MLTATEEYALRAMISIATRPEGGYVLARELSQELSIPQLYLSKILQTLARRGLLDSQRGRRGGFGMAKPAKDISVLDILSAVNGSERFKRCILGFQACCDENPCPLHHVWKAEKDRILEVFSSTRLSDLSGNGPLGPDMKSSPPLQVQRNRRARPHDLLFLTKLKNVLSPYSC
ncbi:MAG: RrF2 family transcriptional regulator [Planctomycetota bacterium]|nr:RrF2 family transcriptional regulator [Planctomycetota bacterium]